MASDSPPGPRPDPDAPPWLGIGRPLLGPEESKAALEVLASGELVKGPRVPAFKRAFADFHRASFAVATSSGATALSAMLLAHDIGAGDEVIVPSFGFFATAAAVVLAGATPVFADIERDTFCLSADAAEAVVTERTRAVMPVHLFGLPADMARFQDLAERRRVLLLEDAAQAHGATFGGHSVGTFGMTAAFSFYATKNMTTLEGGMVLTNDANLADKLRAIRNHGRGPTGAHEYLGSNFRMNELSAAIGLVQLGRLRGATAKRRDNAAYLSARLVGVECPHEPPWYEHVYHQYTVRAQAAERDALVASLRAAHVDARVYYPRPIHEETALDGRYASPLAPLPETERASREVLSLPVHPGLNDGDLDRIVRAVNAFRPAPGG